MCRVRSPRSFGLVGLVLSTHTLPHPVRLNSDSNTENGFISWVVQTAQGFKVFASAKALKLFTTFKAFKCQRRSSTPSPSGVVEVVQAVQVLQVIHRLCKLFQATQVVQTNH